EHSEPKRVWMDFMTQLFVSLCSVFDDRGYVAGAVKELVRHAPADRPAALERGALVDEDLLENQVVAVQVEVVLRIGRCRLDRLGDVARGVLRRELELRERV